MKCPTCQAENPETKQFCGDCGTQLPPPEGHPPLMTETLQTPVRELTTGSTFAGRYQVIEELGHGGMGRVYKVQDTKIGEKIALKLIRPEAGLDKKSLERFSNELKLARKIRHKNVCQMFDLGEDQGTRYITMEYVHGEDLKQLIRKVGRLSPGQSVGIAQQVCDGLEEAHKLGVVHRDLKPQNIMVDEDGKARIMDFGIARSLTGKSMTGAGVLIGTPEYMSPEQVEGKEVDQRSDIYSLGVILYEMVTGRLPFVGETPLSVAHKQKYEVPEDPKKLNAQVSDDLARVILRCLAKDEGKRFQSAAELGTELGRIEEGLPTTDRLVADRKTATSREITLKFTPKKFAIPAVGLIILVAIGILLWHPSPHKPVVSSGKPSLAVLPFENYSGDASLENWRYGFPELLNTGLSASKYLKVLRQDEVNGVLKKLNLSEGKALTSDNIKKIAQEAEVTSLLKASFVKAGANLIITAALVSGQTGETQATLSMKAQSIEKILGGGLDGLVKEIKQGLNITQEQMASDIDVEIGKVMTRNPEALKYYVEGERFHLDLKYGEAIVSLNKAVELDPEFAMAYRLLGVVYGNPGKKKESYEKAFRLKDRMPPREYYILQGQYYEMSEANCPKAIEMYKKVLDIYPDDYLGNHLLATTYANCLGELKLANEQWSRLLKSRPRDLLIHVDVAQTYSLLGEYEKATQTLKEFVTNNPRDDGGHYYLGKFYLMQRRFDLAFQELDQAITICSDKTKYGEATGDISYFKDDLEEATRSYQTWLDNTKSDRDKMTAVWNLNSVDILKGRPEVALMRLKSYQKLFEKTDPSSLHGLRGHAYLASQMPELALEEFKKADDRFWEAVAQFELGNLAEAEKLTGEIDRLIPGFKRKTDSSIPYLRGRLALARKNLPDARKLLDEAVAHYPGEVNWGGGWPNGLYLDSLASACLKMGDADNALKNYEKIALLTYGRYEWGDLYARSFYNLGKIYEQKGLKGKAGENYEKFISLWKDCEPRFQPLVEDARKRLAALKSS